MEQIYVIGDVHTVSAFRLSGINGIVSVREDVAAKLEEIIRKEDAAIVAITDDLAVGLKERIDTININLLFPVVMTIPGIHDMGGERRSVVSYISEALGIIL